MTVRRKISVKGDKEIQQRLRSTAARINNVEAVWPEVGRHISQAVSRQFTTEGAYFGTPWKPLKPEYKLWKIRNGYMRKILQQTGQMRKTFTGRPMDIEVYHGNSATFGSSDQKAIWHNDGTRRNGKRVNPPRKILVLTPKLRGEVKQIIKDYVIKETS